MQDTYLNQKWLGTLTFVLNFFSSTAFMMAGFVAFNTYS